MITVKKEFTVTCEYCDFRKLTPHEGYAAEADIEHIKECPVRKRAFQEGKSDREIMMFLEGYLFAKRTLSQ